MLIPLRLSDQSDEQLMKRAARGSDRAFEELYNRHARRLQGFFVRRLGNDAELAADFMHDTFLRLYAARETYREGRNFRTWLYTIAYNLCRNHHRNQLTIISDEGIDITDDANFEVDLEMKDLHDALREVLRKLPEPYAMLFSLHYEEELTIPQIANIVDLPEGTVKSRLHKTMNIIKQNLKQYEHH
ncbi:MAG: RNA polymerase sigma factor [Bacteroidaceae bacterium]|nr:RNA polymerase sigma factor [Bacteroidaceae bacterium]